MATSNNQLKQLSKKPNKAFSNKDAINPVLRIRKSIKPSDEELEMRSRRDKCKNHLLQRELANRFGCSPGAIRVAESEKRFPSERALTARLAFQKRYVELFGAEFDDGGPSLDQGLRKIDKAMAL